MYIHDTKSHLSRRNFDLINSVNTKESKKNIIMIFKTYFDLLYQVKSPRCAAQKILRESGCLLKATP